MTITLPQEQKFFRLNELKAFGLSLYKIAQLVKNGTLSKVNRFCYENMTYAGEESDFYYAAAYVPRGVICLLSAAAYHGLTTYIPGEIDVAIPRKTRVSTLPDWPTIVLHYYTDARHAFGIETICEGLNHFQVYDLEKTVIDIVHYRESIGIEEMREVLTSYLGRQESNVSKLTEYAKKMGCEKALRTYLEVLV